MSINGTICVIILSFRRVSVASKGGCHVPPPRTWAPQVSICAFVAGVFTGGGGLKNQLKKIAIGIGATCFACDNSDSETNVQGAAAVQLVNSVDALL